MYSTNQKSLMDLLCTDVIAGMQPLKFRAELVQVPMWTSQYFETLAQTIVHVPKLHFSNFKPWTLRPNFEVFNALKITRE